ncbi:MAG: YggS family pyridoxal phosphate-dependent enzyme [Ignavibacteria bacterium]|nr:YggS family pyridoxal phosphate-dependent enzyme [Ignavibacteria bacterium]
MDYAYLKENYTDLLNDIRNACNDFGRKPEDITLVAVSKTFSCREILEVHRQGQAVFGENKVQELRSKYEELKSESIKWHLVGHLQSNKVKYIAEFIDLIHSVDSVHLAGIINEHALKNDRIINILVQVNTTGEDQKSGIEPGDAEAVCTEISLMPGVRLKGLMTIGMFTDEEDIIRKNFVCLRNIYEGLKTKIKTFEYLSMGMTSDYRIAIEEGANMLRIGSAIFGHRIYNNQN